MSKKNQTLLITGLIAGVIVLLTGVDNRFVHLGDGLNFAVLTGLCAGLAFFAWRLIAEENPPNWLLWLGIGAILLRLALGAFWYLALPEWGYDTPVQRAGYVMEDAYNRDLVSWDFAQSGDYLLGAFRNYSARDQYGGLLFLSGFVYRVLGGTIHHPMMMILVGAVFSGSGVWFVWALAKKTWGAPTANVAAWLLAFYPEAVLLGSTQMREAFTPTLALVALYMWISWLEKSEPKKLIPLAFALLLSFALTRPFAAFLLITLVLVWLTLYREALWQSRWRWPLIGVSLLILLGVGFVFSDKFILLLDAAEYQTQISNSTSGWVDRQFERLPSWSHIPFLVSYGVLRPLLPAALVANGAPLWRAVAIFRATGWTAVLAMLLYASFLVLRSDNWRKLPGIYLWVNWVMVFVAAFRAGGDDWDNPRYRAAFAGIQVLVVAWAWVKQRETQDPWLRRFLIMSGSLLFWFLLWYVRRYTVFEWSIIDISNVVGLGLTTGILIWFWDWGLLQEQEIG